jgi:hypothetical protein
VLLAKIDALSSEAAPPQELEKPDLRAGPLQDAKSSLHLILLRQGHRGTPFHDHREEVRYGNLQQFRRPPSPNKVFRYSRRGWILETDEGECCVSMKNPLKGLVDLMKLIPKSEQ